MPKGIPKNGINSGRFIKGSKPWNTGNRGENTPTWNGGITYSLGYRKIFKPEHPAADAKGYVYEHRFLLEQKLGRVLTRNEVVHHKNENRKDNRLENLEVMSRGLHTSLHCKGSVRKSRGKGKSATQSESSCLENKRSS